MNPMVPGLTGDKMSASDVNSKIDLLDTPAEVKKKINKAFCKPGLVEGNGLLAFIKMVLLPIFGTIKISRKEEHGGDLIYTDYQSIEDDYASEKLWPNDLKSGVIASINNLLKPIGEEFKNDKEIQKVDSVAYPKPQAEKKKGGNTPQAITISRLEMKVGKVTKLSIHPDADSLYVEEIDVGEDKPRTVVSGLVKFVKEEDLLNSLVVVITNFKKSKLRGQLSEGMVLAASNEDHTQVEVVRPPEGSKIGERLFVEGCSGDADKQIDASKSRGVWKTLKQDLKANSDGIANFKGDALQTSAGPCKVATLRDVFLS